MPLASMSKVTSIWGTPRGAGGNAGQLEIAEGLVVGRHLPLPLEDVDGHGRLVVGGGGEDLALAAGDGGVLLDQLGHDPAEGFDAQGERGNIEQQDILYLAPQHAGLDGGADGDDLVRD